MLGLLQIGKRGFGIEKLKRMGRVFLEASKKLGNIETHSALCFRNRFGALPIFGSFTTIQNSLYNSCYLNYIFLKYM